MSGKLEKAIQSGQQWVQYERLGPTPSGHAGGNRYWIDTLGMVQVVRYQEGNRREVARLVIKRHPEVEGQLLIYPLPR